MSEHSAYPEDDPRHHTTQLRGKLNEVIEHARADVNKIDDPKAQALFEITAEVCTGLTSALSHYEAESERAWEH